MLLPDDDEDDEDDEDEPLDESVDRGARPAGGESSSSVDGHEPVEVVESASDASSGTAALGGTSESSAGGGGLLRDAGVFGIDQFPSVRKDEWALTWNTPTDPTSKF